MKALRRTLLVLLALLVLAAGGLLLWLSLAEYDPAPVVSLAIEGHGTRDALDGSGTLSLLSFNIGYGALGAEADFFMDGGEGVLPDSADTVTAHLSAISETLIAQDADLVLLQEVDADSARSFGIDERVVLSRGAWAYAPNYRCPFVPYPLPPLGRVDSGLVTMSDAIPLSAQRLSLPCPFSWPMRAANLKRCLLRSEYAVEGTERTLVVFNLHLEAYDDGEGKAAQTAALIALVEEAYAAGSWVIAGGDFNQTFPTSLERWPILHDEHWTPGVLTGEELGDGWRFAADDDTPTCRLLNTPYRAGSPDSQHYVIDGFLLSPNVTLEAVETVDLGFADSDHNPVRLTVRLD